MPLISLRNIQLGFGGPPLLDHLDLTLESGDRACLLGRNGAGKSTLMKVIAGEIQPEDGERVVGQGVRIARLVQEVPERIRALLEERKSLQAELADLRRKLAMGGERGLLASDLLDQLRTIVNP